MVNVEHLVMSACFLSRRGIGHVFTAACDVYDNDQRSGESYTPVLLGVPQTLKPSNGEQKKNTP